MFSPWISIVKKQLTTIVLDVLGFLIIKRFDLYILMTASSYHRLALWKKLNGEDKLIFLSCLVKYFYFVWCKIIIISSCEKGLGEGVSIAVPVRWTVSITKVGTATATGWRVVRNEKVMASSENRSVSRAMTVNSRLVISILRQFYRCPSWLVHQREKECLWVIMITTTHGTCWESMKKT